MNDLKQPTPNEPDESNFCPHCGSYNVTAVQPSEHIDPSNGQRYHFLTCDSCGWHWSEEILDE